MKLKQEEKAEIIELYKQGQCVDQIIRQTGRAFTTVRNVLKAAGIENIRNTKDASPQAITQGSNQDEIKRIAKWARKHGKSYGRAGEILVKCRGCLHYADGNCKYKNMCSFSKIGARPFRERKMYREEI
jgi:transposase-like protein